MAESKDGDFFKEHIDTQRLLKNSRKNIKDILFVTSYDGTL